MPAPTGGFLCLNAGKTYKNGVICYMGVEVSVANILDRAAKLPEKLCEHLSAELLNDYLSKLQDSKIGDVVRLQFGSDGKLVIEKLPEQLPPKNIPNLP